MRGTTIAGIDKAKHAKQANSTLYTIVDNSGLNSETSFDDSKETIQNQDLKTAVTKSGRLIVENLTIDL